MSRGGPEGGTRRPVFSLDGRAAPGLYAAGWLLSLVGGAVVFVAFAASGGERALAMALFIGGLSMAGLGLIAAAGAQALQRRADGWTGYRGPSPLLVFAASLALNLLAGAGLALSGLFDDTTSPGVLISLLLTALINLGLIGFLVVGSGSLTWTEMGIRAATASRLAGDLLAGLATGLLAYGITIVLVAVLVTLLGVTPQGPLPKPSTAADFVVNIVAAAIVAPLGEELFFRGFATTAWLRSLGPGRAVARSAVFFALVHVLTLSGATFSESVRLAAVAFIGRLPVAYLLGWIFVRRDSLWASISAHAAFNGVALVLAELAGRSLAGS